MNIEPRDEELIQLCRECLNICTKLSVQPILYGGLAVAYHTKDFTTQIRDIDFILSETFFKEMVTLLQRLPNVICIQKDHHGLKVQRNKSVIEFDSLEQTSLIEPISIDIRIYGLTMRVLALNPLMEIYERSAAKDSEKSERYLEKLKLLYLAKANRYNTL